MDIWQILTITMAIATAVSLIVACISYYKPRKRQKLLYQTTTIQYFEEDDYTLPSDAIMTFQGQKVARLTKAMLILWNGGIDALRGEDIVQHDPIRISLSATGKILDYSIIGGTNDGNRVVVQIPSHSQNELIVTYDYLNPNDGAVIQVLHDAEQRDPTVVGTAKGLSEGPRGLGAVVHYHLDIPRRKRRRRFLLRFMLVMGLLCVLLGGLQAMSLIVPDLNPSLADAIWLFAEERELFSAVLITVSGLVYLSLPLYEFLTNRRRYPKSLDRFLQSQAGESPTTPPKAFWLFQKRRDEEIT